MCTRFNELQDEKEEDFFKYQTLNQALKKVKTYFSWVVGKVTGLTWKQYQRKKLQRQCMLLAKKLRRKFIFPKYQMFNIRSKYIQFIAFL